MPNYSLFYCLTLGRTMWYLSCQFSRVDFEYGGSIALFADQFHVPYFVHGFIFCPNMFPPCLQCSWDVLCSGCQCCGIYIRHVEVSIIFVEKKISEVYIYINSGGRR